MESQFDLLPNLFLLGVPRSGTTSMVHYLEFQPTVRFTTPRAPYFYTDEALFGRGMRFYQQSFCRELRGAVWRGEASPTYLAQPHVVGPRLRQVYGEQELRFLVLLREPVARAWSHYLYRVHHGCETRDFATAIQDEIAGDGGYFVTGRYAHLLEQWQQYYALECFKLVLSEDMAGDPRRQVGQVFCWLGLPEMAIDVHTRLNQAGYSRNPWLVRFLNRPPGWLSGVARRIWQEQWVRNAIRHYLRMRVHVPYRSLPHLDEEIAHRLRVRYRDDTLRLGDMLGRYLSHWLPDESPLG